MKIKILEIGYTTLYVANKDYLKALTYGSMYAMKNKELNICWGEYMLYENELLYQMLQEIPAKDEFGQTNEYYGKSKPEIAVFKTKTT